MLAAARPSCLYYCRHRALAQTPGERAPQSEYVRVEHDGSCIWWPMYEQSVSHCPMSVRKFPFDTQRCYLVYESWKYNSSQLNITSSLEPDSVNRHFQTSEQWDLVGTYAGQKSTVNRKHCLTAGTPAVCALTPIYF